MAVSEEVYDVVIIGAGPSGLACAIAAGQHNLNYLVLDKGCLVNSIYHFPTNLVFFSTPDLLEIGNLPFIISAEKPTRTDVLKYYRRVADHFNLRLNLFERVERVEGRLPDFRVTTSENRYRCRHLVVATGQFDHPNMMNIPGENLEKVHHYYREGHPYYRKKVAVIGGKNSAVEAALDLYKHHAEVTLIHRGETFGSSVKYWILPDIQNRIEEGKITALFNTVVTEICQDHLVLRRRDGSETTLANDVVFALTGYRPDEAFLRKLGLELDAECAPVHDPKTLETNVPGVYIAGVLTAGADGSKVFIENSRNHGNLIMGHIRNGKK